MCRCVCRLILGLFLSLSATALADDFKVIQLEQDVRNLERQVADLSRRLNELQRLGRQADPPALSAPTAANAVQPDDPLWFDVANWDRVSAGMSELEVIRLLGKPTSMRSGEVADARTLFYATEIGSSGFLSGSVQLKNRHVVSVDKPVLK